jgi:NAD(P)-dependent dehydrogenase (short-subunit alcohol dehydrogenase family)
MARGDWTADRMPPQNGRVAVVTGANSGLGFVTARELARRGARVVMGCRDPEKGSAARARILAEVPGADVALEPLDLADLSSVADFARRLLAHGERVDLLVNNAGIMGVPEGRTRDGFELQVGTNHLGHFALTARLHGAIARTPGSRVVTVTSLGYRIGRIDVDDLASSRSYDRWAAYGRSKLANLLFASEYQRRLASAGASAISVAAHPGYAATNLQQIRASTLAQHAYNAVIAVMNRTLAATAAAGALPQLYAATAPDVTPGGFYGPDRWLGLRGAPAPQAVRPHAQDRLLAERLWKRSEELVGLAFGV